MRRADSCLLTAWLVATACSRLALGYDLGNDSYVSDALGNTADNESVITWAYNPTLVAYVTDTSYDDGPLEPFLNMMNGFINLLMPKDPDYELLVQVYKGDVAVGGAAKDVALSVIGYLLFLAIGILFLFIFPLVGCCVCCCRNCGNCGGKRVHKKPSECKCITFTLILDGMVTSLVIGASYTLIMNDRMGTALNYTSEAPSNNLNDVKNFLDNTLTEIDYYAYGGFNFTKQVIERDLNYVGEIVGTQVQDYYGNAGLYNVLQELENMADLVDQTIDLVNQTEQQKQKLQDACDAYNNALEAADHFNGLNTYFDDCSSRPPNCQDLKDQVSGLWCHINVTLMQDLSSTLSELQTLKDADLRTTAKQGRQDFDDLPELITNQTASARSEVNTLLDDAQTELDNGLDRKSELESQKSSVTSLDDSLNDFLKLLTDYEDFRRLAFYALTLLISLISVFWILPLCCAPFSYKPITDPDNPPHRPCCSECCGCCMMAGAGLAWIFTTILMLFVVLPYMIGAPIEKIFCQPLMDPEYKFFNYLDGPDGLLDSDGYFLSEKLFNNGTIELTIATMLEDCRQNKAVWQALKLENLLDLNSITKELDNLNVSGTLSSADVSSVSGTTLLSAETEQQLEEFANSTSAIDYSALVTATSQNWTLTNVTQFLLDLEAYGTANANNHYLERTNLSDIYTTLGEGGVQTELDSLKSTVISLETTAGSIPDQVTNLTTSAKEFEANFSSGGVTVALQAIEDYANRILSVVTSYKNYLINSLENEIGKCLPVWNAWYSLVHLALCKYTIWSWNGFWFSLGWCCFTMFMSIIFSIKLAKYFRRTHPPEEEEDDEDEESEEDREEPGPFKSSQQKPWQRSNTEYSSPPTYSAAVKDMHQAAFF